MNRYPPSGCQPPVSETLLYTIVKGLALIWKGWPLQPR